jgi:carboxylate-amine ligase
MRAMGPRTVGVEEELLLVNPATRHASPRAGELLARVHREHGDRGLDKELFQHQVEIRTDPSRDLATLRAELGIARATVGRAARTMGLAAVAVGTVPLVEDVRLTPDRRYEDMVGQYADIARHAGTCGMHVHVGIESAEEGVAIIDRIGPWLPVLRAVSANSPYAEGRDTGYASWRSQLWSHWPSAGPTEAFSSLTAYQQLSRELQEFGAALDPGMLYFDARLSARQPTVEVRIFDVCTDPGDSVFLAALVRGLVEHAARGWRSGEPAPAWRTEALRAAHWRASRLGLSDTLVHPLQRRLAPVRTVLEAVVGHVREELEEAGDHERVGAGVARLLGGGGAVHQRRAFVRGGGIAGVVDDLVLRSERVWAEHDVGTTPAQRNTP